MLKTNQAVRAVLMIFQEMNLKEEENKEPDIKQNVQKSKRQKRTNAIMTMITVMSIITIINCHWQIHSTRIVLKSVLIL